MRTTWIFAGILGAGLMAGCGGSSSDDAPAADQGSIEVMAVSGTTVTLSGNSYTTDCYNTGGADRKDTAAFVGDQMVREVTLYTSNDGSCSSGGTVDGAFTTSWEASASASAITGWVDGSGSSTTAPAAEDGSGSLASDEDVTTATIEVLTASGSNAPAVGVTDSNFFFVVDDTDLSSGGCVVLYRSDGTNATTADPFKSSACGQAASSSIEVLTVSGSTFTLTGKSFTTDCYLINGGAGPDKDETTTFTSTEMQREANTYSTSDGSCSGAPATTETFTTDWDETGTITTFGWVDGSGGTSVSAPQAVDGSTLSDNEDVTHAEIEVLTSSSGSPAVGHTGPMFFVVDDTDIGNSGCVVLWRNDTSNEISIADPFKNSSCP